MLSATINDATLGVLAQQDDHNAYYIGLGFFSEGNRVKLWKHSAATGWETWFTPEWDWKIGKPYRLKLVVDAGVIKGYVDGKLIAVKKDDHPHKPLRVALDAYCCSGWFDDLSIRSGDGKAQVSDDFSKFNPDVWEPFTSGFQRLQQFADAGVHLYSFGVGDIWGTNPSNFWTAKGSYDYSSVDAVLASVIEADPKAFIIPRVGLDALGWWRQAHPDELNVAWREGKLGVWGRQSFSSQAWLRDTGEALRKFVRHIEGSRFGESVIGYHICAGASGEWSYCWGGEFYDYSKPHLEAFRQWLRERYGGDVQRLRESWRDDNATFEKATIPSGERRLKGDLFEFFNPAISRQVSDYLEFHHRAMARAILNFSRIVKQETHRKKLVGVFYGYHFFSEAGPWFECGHRAFAEVLNSPDIDFIAAPHNYRERQPGGVCLPQTVSSSIRLHGKLYYDEDDTRTSLSPINANFGRADTVEQSIEVLKRNFAAAMTEGGTLWWMEQSPGWFAHPKILATIRRMQELATELLNRDRRRSAEIAVIVSDQSAYYLRYSPSLIEPLICDQMVEQVTRIGAPFDVYIADDLELLPDYKFYIFLTPFLTEEQRRIIKERVLRDGHTVLWVYAPGFVNPNGLSVEAMSDLTGIRLKTDELGGRVRLVLTDFNHEITRHLPTGLLFGTREPIGPLFWCDDPKAQVVGELYAMPALNRDWKWAQGMTVKPGLAVKEMGSWRSVWCGVPNIPACLLRSIAKVGGVHIYSDQDDAVYANNVLLAVHTRHAGKRTIRLPRRAARVADAFTGKPIAKRTDSFSVTLGRAQTGCWVVEYNLSENGNGNQNQNQNGK